ncbi:MAG: PspC domain-containing protein [Candidatus Paceibacterota bacterium]
MRFSSSGEGFNRESNGAVWLGVCKGFSMSTGVSVFKIRLLFVLCSIFITPFLALLIYGMLALMMPKKSEWVDRMSADDIVSVKLLLLGFYITYIVLASYIITVSLP